MRDRQILVDLRNVIFGSGLIILIIFFYIFIIKLLHKM